MPILIPVGVVAFSVSPADNVKLSIVILLPVNSTLTPPPPVVASI